MKPTTTGCPPTEELRQLIDGTLSGERQVECTEHMDSCQCCQSRLEEIACDGSNMSKVVQHINQDEPMATSAYWPALQALGAGGLSHTVAAPSSATGRRGNLQLTFLEPPSDAAYLGRLAHFDVMRVLGRGGMGVVLEAFDSRLQRNVALKVLDPDLAGDELAKQRFCREARAAASISHEHVVAVHQVEKFGDGMAYLVMQLISGESLEQRLQRETKLPFREIVRISMQAAQGLTAAHAQGLIHRDIKPGNILLEAPQDRVKLTDFGLARAAEDVKLTRTGFVSGTPLYMAPEQALGEASDHRSDLFSLGAIMYEMCAGQPPFVGNSALAVMRQITDGKYRPLREVSPSTPDWLATTIDRLLARKPSDRIQSAAHLAELLEFQWALMKTSSEDVPTVCKIEQARRARRNLLIAAGVGVTALALGVFGGMLFNRNRGAVGEPATAGVSSAEPLAVLPANSGAVWSVSFDPPSNYVAMGVEDGTVRLWDLPTKSVKSILPAHRGTVWQSLFAHNGELLATGGDDGFVKLWKPDETEPIKTFKNSSAVRGLAWSADDKTIFAGDRQGGVYVWSIDQDEPLAQTIQPGSVYAVVLSPDGATLATAGTDKIVRLWNAKALTQKLPLEGHTAPVYGLSYRPDGQRLASVGWDKNIMIWDVASGQLAHSWKGNGGDIWSVSYSPDGKKLATGEHDGSVKLWNAETGELLATFVGHQFAIHTVAFNRDGTRLASGGRDGAVRIWKID